MKLKILTPYALILDEEISSVTLPGTEGEMTILEHHAALVATLKKGKIRYKMGEREMTGNGIDGGFVEVLGDTVLVMTREWQVAGANPSPR